MKTPSKERGCEGKTNLGRDYQTQADKMARKHGKSYGVYNCPHCAGWHLTTKLSNATDYGGLLYVTQASDNPAAATSRNSQS